MNHLSERMATGTDLNRRRFLRTCSLGIAAAGAARLRTLGAGEQPPNTPAPQLPLKLGIRAATMKMVGDIGVIQTAAAMSGIRGVELQVTAGDRNLRDWAVVREYKRESDRWDIRIPSIAG